MTTTDDPLTPEGAQFPLARPETASPSWDEPSPAGVRPWGCGRRPFLGPGSRAPRCPPSGLLPTPVRLARATRIRKWLAQASTSTPE